MIFGRKKVKNISQPDLVAKPDTRQLSLSGHGVTDFMWKEFAQFCPLLNFLDLSRNTLTFVSPSVALFQNLTDLNLASNSLTDIPTEITTLSNLKKLSVANNHIISLPQCIGDMEKLEKLNLSGNSLSYLPTSILNLLNLEKLSISDNPLIFPPVSLCNSKPQLTFQIMSTIIRLMSVPGTVKYCLGEPKEEIMEAAKKDHNWDLKEIFSRNGKYYNVCMSVTYSAYLHQNDLNYMEDRCTVYMEIDKFLFTNTELLPMDYDPWEEDKKKRLMELDKEKERPSPRNSPRNQGPANSSKNLREEAPPLRISTRERQEALLMNARHKSANFRPLKRPINPRSGIAAREKSEGSGIIRIVRPDGDFMEKENKNSSENNESRLQMKGPEISQTECYSDRRTEKEGDTPESPGIENPENPENPETEAQFLEKQRLGRLRCVSRKSRPMRMDLMEKSDFSEPIHGTQPQQPPIPLENPANGETIPPNSECSQKPEISFSEQHQSGNSEDPEIFPGSHKILDSRVSEDPEKSNGSLKNPDPRISEDPEIFPGSQKIPDSRVSEDSEKFPGPLKNPGVVSKSRRMPRKANTVHSVTPPPHVFQLMVKEEVKDNPSYVGRKKTPQKRTSGELNPVSRNFDQKNLSALEKIPVTGKFNDFMEKEIPKRKFGDFPEDTEILKKGISADFTKKEIPKGKSGDCLEKEIPKKKISVDFTEKEIPKGKSGDSLEKEITKKEISADFKENEIPKRKSGDCLEKEIPKKEISSDFTENEIQKRKSGDCLEKEIPKKGISADFTEKEIPKKETNPNVSPPGDEIPMDQVSRNLNLPDLKKDRKKVKNQEPKIPNTITVDRKSTPTVSTRLRKSPRETESRKSIPTGKGGGGPDPFSLNFQKNPSPVETPSAGDCFAKSLTSRKDSPRDDIPGSLSARLMSTNSMGRETRKKGERDPEYPKTIDCTSYVPKNNSDMCLFAVFDGHGGSGSVQYLEKNLFPAIINQKKKFQSSDFKGGITDAFMAVDTALLRKLEKYRDISGSTAILGLLNGNYLLIAWIGDSRGVLCRGKKPVELSFDHTPLRYDEKKRIEKLGGKINLNDKKGDAPRVMQSLAVTRAFGDSKLKKSKLILVEPEFTETILLPEDQFMVFATDGLWDVMNEDDVVGFVLKCEDKMKASEQLVNQAIELGAKDNICALVVYFTWSVDLIK